MAAGPTANALVVSGDSNPAFAQGLAVTVYSALSRLDPTAQPVLYILDCGLSEQVTDRLKGVANRARGDIEVRVVEVDLDRLNALPKQVYFPPVAFARLFIDELVSNQIERAVYLDADLLICRDVSPLFSMDIGAAPIAAVQDLHIKDVGGNPARPYFNTGVLMIDVPAWRSNEIGGNALQYVWNQQDLPMADQDALNAVIADWHQLAYGWNLQVGALLGGVMPEMPEGWIARDELKLLLGRARGKPSILHFTVRKPWNPSHGPLPSAWRWAVCLARSGWFTRLQASLWLARWFGAWLRYVIGTARLKRQRLD